MGAIGVIFMNSNFELRPNPDISREELKEKIESNKA